MVNIRWQMFDVGWVVDEWCDSGWWDGRMVNR